MSARSILWRSRIPLRSRGPYSGCAMTSSSSGGRPRRPLPEKFAERLGLPLARVAECTSEYLHGSASALASRQAPPPLKPMEDALAAYNSEIAALRSEGLTRTLSIAVVEQLFTLGFALEQLHRNVVDLERRVQEWARPLRSDRGGPHGP